MSKGDVVDEPSMDEILTSIRKIIAEDEVDEPHHAAKGRTEPQARPPAPNPEMNDVLDVEDDVLELTLDDETSTLDEQGDEDEAVILEADDATPTDDFADLIDQPAADAAPSDAAPSDDVPPDDAPATSFAEAEVEVEAPPPAGDATPEQTTSEAPAVLMDNLTEVLLDSGTSSIASSALQRLSAAIAPGDAVAGGQRSIEVFLADLVRPELKAWLDTNLPPLVERIVEREIKKLVRDAQPE
ncbi:MAG: DUF2497 domain-containing protein [Geminicoccaceae bacterium]|nr:MAG: DUF2497 domain-containing protein [Geminicoccaceae bacterium]